MAEKKSNAKNYVLNRVDGFNPYDHLETALDRTGNPILKKDGTELKYISTAAKTLWFRMVKPNGRLETVSVPVDPVDTIGMVIRYRSSVYFDVKDESPAASWEHQETIWDISDMDKVVSRCQTVALGKALSKAGFGCEVEMALDIGSEGENPETEKESVKKAPKKKAVKAEPVSEEAKEAVESEVSDMLDSIEMEISSEKEAEEAAPEVVDHLEEALNVELECTEKAPVNIRTLEGLPLRDIIATHPSFCTLVKTKKNVREAISEASAEAAIYIADNM